MMSKDWACLALAGRDAVIPTVRGTYDPTLGLPYHHLDIVALNGGTFIAKRDNPGACPGDDWQLLASQGKRGDKGERGERGERGPVGPTSAPAVTIKGWTIDSHHYRAVPVMSDGSMGPTLELRDLFQQFNVETR